MMCCYAGGRLGHVHQHPNYLQQLPTNTMPGWQALYCHRFSPLTGAQRDRRPPKLCRGLCRVGTGHSSTAKDHRPVRRTVLRTHLNGCSPCRVGTRLRAATPAAGQQAQSPGAALKLPIPQPPYVSSVRQSCEGIPPSPPQQPAQPCLPDHARALQHGPEAATRPHAPDSRREHAPPHAALD
jgi:hypothetical protein